MSPLMPMITLMPPLSSPTTPSPPHLRGRGWGPSHLRWEGEQLSFLSYGFGLPFSAAAEHGIEGDDELSHDRDDGDLGLLAGGAEALLEGLEVGVPDGGGLSGHEEDASNIGAAAEDTAQAAHFAAVEVVGHDADEGGDLAVGDVAEFGQQGDQGGAKDRTDAAHRADQLLAGREVRLGGDRLDDALVEPGPVGLPLADAAPPPPGTAE